MMAFSSVCVHVLCVLFVYKIVVEAATNNTVCMDGTSNADYKIKAIDAAFGQSNITDVVFLVDRSQSIYVQGFKNTKETIRTLMDYLMLRRLLYLHKDYTRVAVVSFGLQSMVQSDGISSDSGTYHACNFDDKLGSIELGTAGRNATNMEAALKKADEMFWSKSNSRSDANKVLWVFYDGEKDFPTGAVGKLKRQGVTVFSAGVGAPPYGWMNSAERENNVISFADDKYHYACAEDWMSIINNVTSNEKENIIDASDNERALYVPDDTYTKGKCSSCPRLQRCVCNVLNRRYTCAKYDVTPTQNTHREVNPLLIIIIVGSATAVLLILIVCCICCICCWRRRRTKHREDSLPQVAPRVPPRQTAADGAPPDDKAVYYNESVTPPEVTPRLAPRRAGRPTVSGDIPSTRVAYFNASQFVTSRPDVVPPQDANDQAADDEGCASVARSRDTRQTVDLNMSTDNGIGQDQDWLNQPVDRDPQNDVGANGIVKGNLSSKSSNSYNYAYDQFLMGPVKCRLHVVETARTRGLQGLLVYNTHRSLHWAATSRFILPPLEIKTLRNVLRRRNISTHNDVTVSGKTYTIDRTELSDEHLHATSERGEHLWVAIQGDFIIVGVAGPDKREDCVDVVIDLQRYLQQSDNRTDESTS